jgi:hypothetical protein
MLKIGGVWREKLVRFSISELGPEIQTKHDPDEHFIAVVRRRHVV